MQYKLIKLPYLIASMSAVFVGNLMILNDFIVELKQVIILQKDVISIINYFLSTTFVSH